MEKNIEQVTAILKEILAISYQEDLEPGEGRRDLTSIYRHTQEALRLIEYAGEMEEGVDAEVENVWQTFWAGIVTRADGCLNLEQVKKELYDFWVCIGEVSKVYDVITNGKFSKPKTQHQFVIDAVNEQIRAMAHLDHGDLSCGCSGERKLLEISGLVSERHGDDGRYSCSEDEYDDMPEVITIKRIFKILDGESEKPEGGEG